MVYHPGFVADISISWPNSGIQFREKPNLTVVSSYWPFKNYSPFLPCFLLFLLDMNIDAKMVDNLAHLARLRFDDSEKESIRADLEKMVAFVEKLQTIDTTGVAPLLHISDVANVLREDEVKGSISREEALLNSPVKDGVFFKVPTVIKK